MAFKMKDIVKNDNSVFVNGHYSNPEENPNYLAFKKLETMLDRMQSDDDTAVPVKTVKGFMTKIPSVFTGADLVGWLLRYVDLEDQVEALHIAHLMASHGYIFPIDDHVLTVKNDNTYYRFQTPCLWPSRVLEPENTDYAVYLCKRTMQSKQRLELADFEAENLARLQKMFSRKWEFIYMQAEAQIKVDKKREKLERKILDSQERAFWDVHRPVPGCVNTTDVDIRKTCKQNKQGCCKLGFLVPGGRISPTISENDLRPAQEILQLEIDVLKKQMSKSRMKISKVGESYIAHFEQYQDFDSLWGTTTEFSNPWITDNTELWDQESTVVAKDIPARRVKRWGFSILELLKDPAGTDNFTKFLAKEFSGENLKFWLACRDLKTLPQSQVQDKVLEIYEEFLAPNARDPVNIDSRVADIVKQNVQNDINRYCLDAAEEHIFKLMKNDSYNRYLRSDMYKEFLTGTVKKKYSRTVFIPKLPSFSGLTN